MSKTFLATAVVVATCAVGTTALADDTTPKSDTSTNTKSETTKSSTTKTKKAKDTSKKSSDTAGEMNKSVVGEEQQKENVKKAEEPRPSEAQQKKEAKETGNAVGSATTTAAETVEGVARATNAPGKYNPFAVEWNPLSLVVGRVAFNFEWAPVTHHVLIVQPQFTHQTDEVALSPDTHVSQHFTGGGLELGYRYYTGTRGMNGIFLGGSLIGGGYNADLPNGSQGYATYGVAADVGIQEIIGEHFVVGGGAGLALLGVSKEFGDLERLSGSIATSGLKLRVLAQAGYAF